MAETDEPPKGDRRPLNFQLSDAVAKLTAVQKELAERDKIIEELRGHATDAGEDHEATNLTLAQLRQDYKNVCNIVESKEREVKVPCA